MLDEYDVEIVRDSSDAKAVILYNITKDHSIWVIELSEWDRLHEKVKEELEQIEKWKLDEQRVKQTISGI